MNYQWYPGHMTKARRMMEENIQLIDLMIELLDARIPDASRNPDIHILGKNKARLVILNKADLADDKINKKWIKAFQEQGITALEINSKNGEGIKNIQSAVQTACKEKIERDRRRGIIARPVRAMVVGIPNVGKSTLINAIAGKASAKTGNRPGVTKGKQWIRLNKNLELLDTPGILWPKMADEMTGLRLALVGSMNDEILSSEEMAYELIRILESDYPGILEKRFPVLEGTADPVEMMQKIARSRGCLLKGEELDLVKASAILMDEFRNGKLGRISLESPAEKETVTE